MTQAFPGSEALVRDGGGGLTAASPNLSSHPQRPPCDLVGKAPKPFAGVRAPLHSLSHLCLPQGHGQAPAQSQGGAEEWGEGRAGCDTPGGVGASHGIYLTEQLYQRARCM